MPSVASSRFSPPWVKPYDPADSPGPIPSVIERFRPRPDEPDQPVMDEAAKLIEEACGEAVTLVEHHSDLTYWTAHLRD
jgi:hypothetical protein